MAKIAYERWTPSADTQRELLRADQLAQSYADRGLDLTLRQLYYQFVKNAWIPNTMQSYKRLGEILNRGRLAGYIDWDHLQDMTRELEGNSHWESPADVIRSALRSYRLDTWVGQPWRVEVWVEKQALASIVGTACRALDVDWFACRGYVSQSEMHAAAERIGRYLRAGQRVTVLHLGDHDPSGMDMTRDIRDRLEKFVYSDAAVELGMADEGEEVEGWQVEQEIVGEWMAESPLDESLSVLEVERIALNMDQVRRYQPPPNPAKITDSRAVGYIRGYGRESWELDALSPEQLSELVTVEVSARLDEGLRAQRQMEQEAGRDRLRTVSRRWGRVLELIEADPE